MNIDNDVKKTHSATTVLKFIGCSFIGILIFFIPISIGGDSTIMLDHMVTFIKKTFSPVIPYYALIMVIIGAVMPFIRKTWNKSVTDIIFSVFKIIGVGVAFMAVFGFGPEILFRPDLVPFLFNVLVVSVGIIVPVGAVFLAFLVNYGLLEFIGIIMEPVMKPIWKTPGRSAIDAVASFVGSYSIGLLITNRVFKEGKYTVKEACIIATGFSTVSATFMIVVAKTLGMMDYWNTYFWSTLVITFLVSAITVRIYPLSKKSDEYVVKNPDVYVRKEGNIFKNAWEAGLEAAENTPPFFKNIFDNLKDGFNMTMGILPTIVSIGLLGILLAEFTPVFDIVGYIFYPVTKLMGTPEPMLIAKASALQVAEMFLPALLVVGADMVTKYIVGVVSISAILFFSSMIPCIMATEIPLSMKDIMIIWIERTVLTLIIATPIAFLLFG